VTVNVVAVVEMSRAEFEAAQDSFLQGLASAAGVDISKVKIVSITEIALRRGFITSYPSNPNTAAPKKESTNEIRHGIGSNRQLLATAVEVTTAVETTVAQSDSMVESLSGDAVKEQMSARGFKVDVKGVQVAILPTINREIRQSRC
jgi:hypothetical protein